MSIITLIFGKLGCLGIFLYPLPGDHRYDFCSDSSGFRHVARGIGAAVGQYTFQKPRSLQRADSCFDLDCDLCAA